MTAFIVLGMIIHCFSHRYGYVLSSEQESFFLAVLQIHATVITLALTVITLIAGLGYSVYGISAADFFINRKPVILTQKAVVIMSLILLCISIVMHYAGVMRCMALYIFLASVSGIIYSVSEIYPVFNGAYYVKSEVRNWLKDTMKTCPDDAVILSLFEAFMSDWQDHAGQTSQEYNDYADIYSTMINRILQP